MTVKPSHPVSSRSGSVAAYAGRLTWWVGLYLVAGVLGRMTIIDSESMSLVWPAAGVAALWLATSERRWVPFDLAALAVLVFIVNSLTGATTGLALLFVVTNLLQAGGFVLLVRWRAPDLRHFGGHRPPSTLADLGTVLTAAAAASGGAALLGQLGLGVLGMTPDLTSLLVWWGRNAAGLIVVGMLGLLVLGRLAELARQRTGRRGAPRPALGDVVEPLVLHGIAVALVWFIFGASQVLPIGFLLLFATVLVAIRLGPLNVAVHTLLVGTGAVVLTLAGRGPFAAVVDMSERALVAQVFVMMTIVTGLVLAFNREERNQALGELRAAQAEAEARARLFAGVLEHMQEGVAVFDTEGNYLMHNPAGQRLSGVQEDSLDAEADGARYGLRHLDGSEVPARQLPFCRAVRGEVVHEDFRFRAPGSEREIIMEIKAAPMVVDNRPTAIVVFRDVTAARHDRDALASFAGIVAHDLKRPLAVVKGWSGALSEELVRGPVPVETGMPMLERVTRAADQMTTLIDDLLHYTVVRDAPVHEVVVDVSEVAREASAIFSERSTRPAISVQAGIEAVADPVMVRQILDNLVGNAIKYVAPEVRPEVQVAGRSEDGWTVLTVTDNGIGIPADQRERIFETFHRVDREAYRGTGLGLAIVRRAAERSGGSVTLRDNPGGGTVFEVRLPAAPVAEPQVRPTPHARAVVASSSPG